jgi:segregation and condensation protein B
MALKNDIEALLFSSGKAMDETKLCELTGQQPRAIRAALKALAKEYDDHDGALRLFNEGSTWKMMVRDEHIPLVRRIVADTELSRATMETLAVIAYNHPNAMQSKVVDTRGSSAYDHIKELIDLGFVTRTKHGRSFMLRLPEKFFDYFDVDGKGIKKAFSGVKAPEPKEQQQQLDGLQVVDVAAKPDAGVKTFDGLEIVDQLGERPRKSASSSSDRDEPPETTQESAPAKLERDTGAEKDWLQSIESKIDEITRRNDEREQDKDFKVPEQTPPTEGAAPETTEQEPSEPGAKE